MEEVGEGSSKPASRGNPEEYHNTFRVLLHDIQEDLESRGVLVSNEFVILLVKLASLDPPNKFLIKQQMVQSELDRMKKIVVERIVSMSSLSRNTILMQLHYQMNYYNRDDSIDAHRENQESKISSLMNEMKSGIPRNLRHYDYWYAKLIGATIIEADMGPASEGSVVKETEAALSTVFPKDDINLLESMTLKDREMELYHLMHITIGIRLYTKNLNPENYGTFIENLPTILTEKIEASTQKMAEMRAQNIKRLIRYTSLIQPYFLQHVSSKMDRRAVTNDMVIVRQGLVMIHQTLIYLKELNDDLNREKDICSQLIYVYNNILSELGSIVNDSKSAPTSVVYPKFVELYEAWRNLQDANVFIDSIQELNDTLDNINNENLLKLDELVNLMIGGSRVPTEKEFFYFPNVNLPDDKYALAKTVEFREEFDPLNMSYSGFCIHSLVKGVGLVVLSNPQLGVFTWKNQNFLVSTPKAALEFRRDPEPFIRKANAIARRWPELIALLGIEKKAFDPGSVSDADRYMKTTNVLISADADVQTELHPTPTRMIEHYTWNEWELRRRGLVLSKIHKCVTHSTQTHWQALKQNADCQTFSIKSTQIQTNHSVHSDLPLSQFYIYGLRGLHCDIPPHVVEITQDNPMDLKCMLSKKKLPEIDLTESDPFAALKESEA